MRTIVLIEHETIFLLGIIQLLDNSFPNMKIESRRDLLSSFQADSRDEPALIILGLCPRQTDYKNKKIIIRVKDLYPNSPILTIIENSNIEIVSFMFRAGIKGCIYRWDDMDEYRSGITKLLSGGVFASNKISFEIVQYFSTQGRKEISIRKKENILVSNGESHKLTNRQNEIASLLCKGVKSGDICNILGIKPSTVSTTKRIVFDKLGIRNVFELRSKIYSLN